MKTPPLFFIKRFVYVELEFRNRGYARALTNAVIEWLTYKEIKTIRLLASHNARKLYEHTLRSSIWKYRDNRWQMFFHQGTKTNVSL